MEAWLLLLMLVMDIASCALVKQHFAQNLLQIF